jgi:hypothetical protein
MPKAPKIEIEIIRAKDQTKDQKVITVTMVYVLFNDKGERVWVKEVDVPLNFNPQLDVIPESVVSSSRKVNVY